MIQRSACVFLVLAMLSGCAGQAPGDGGPSGRLRVAVAPLGYADVSDVVYRLTVSTPAGTVWSEDISSATYGDGVGSATYVGTCDASAGPNTVSLALLSIRADRLLVDGVDYVNPAPLARPLTRVAACAPNADTPVDFALTVMRRASQGFFDIAVTFDDIFCSAKFDCLGSDGQPLALLHDPRTGERGPTAVLGFSCWSGGRATVLHMAPIHISCSGPGPDLDVDVSTPGLHNPPFGPAPNTTDLLFQTASYIGADAVPDAAAPARYQNVALGLNQAAFATLGTCTLTARATASESTSPDFAAGYPVVDWRIPLVTDGALSCTRYPLFSDEVRTSYLDAPYSFGGAAEPEPLAPASWAFEVRDERGDPIPEVTVSVGAQSATTGSDGTATLADLPVALGADGRVVPALARLRANGYAAAVSELALAPGETATTLEHLVAYAPPEVFEPAGGLGSVVDGVAIDVPPAAFDAPGDTAELDLAVPARAAGALAAGPGPALATDGGALTPIALAEVTLLDGGGVPAVLAAGQTIGITLPVPPGLVPALADGSLVPVVASFEATLGRWRPEAVAGTLDESLPGWRIAAPHLTWWGIFLPYPHAPLGCVEVQVLDAETELPLPGATIYAIDPEAPVPPLVDWGGFAWVARATADADGRACLQVPRGLELRVAARAAVHPFEIGEPTLVTAPPDVAGHCPAHLISTSGSGITPSEGCVGVTLRLAGAFCVRGQVRYHTGVALADSAIRMTGHGFLGDVSQVATTDASGHYCVPMPERQMSVHASDELGQDHVSSFAVDPPTVFDPATCDAGVCRAAPDLVIPDLSQPITCVSGTAWQDDHGAIADGVRPLAIGSPVYLFAGSVAPTCSASPDWHCTGAPSSWGELLASGSVVDASGAFSVDLGALAASPPSDATLVPGGCNYTPGFCQCPGNSIVGIGDLTGLTPTLGPGGALCGDVGRVTINQFCPF
ncbi:MAG: carboxypeptidase-like regulatory domain-containing protein [Myxococcota bacterium]